MDLDWWSDIHWRAGSRSLFADIHISNSFVSLSKTKPPLFIFHTFRLYFKVGFQYFRTSADSTAVHSIDSSSIIYSSPTPPSLVSITNLFWTQRRSYSCCQRHFCFVFQVICLALSLFSISFIVSMFSSIELLNLLICCHDLPWDKGLGSGKSFFVTCVHD